MRQFEALKGKELLEDEEISFDIYDVVKYLRECRMGMVQTLDQYKYCQKFLENKISKI
jgi:protein tyrosine phosphatase